ncbi:uncharacterized protein LOC131149211 isoform X1 [Malania oleifera]|uniref:uncharacterized protein LOC131149211 isoform X1 n=1 Tax=Malania oleifera TaxID=397392 RepID=UPI0025AE3B5E|nr:uncharacterized protein LOC131149211 isoform X1 [Malania oleifera]
MVALPLVNKVVSSGTTGGGRGRDEVYVGAVGLRATKGPPQLLMSAAYSLRLWHFHHFIVIIKSSIPPLSQGLYVFDFQPEDPENMDVALAALFGKPVPGIVLTRKLMKLPKNKCFFVGSSKVDNAIDAAYEFNSNWETDLRIGYHDCRHYTNGLVECLTGETLVLERLKKTLW